MLEERDKHLPRFLKAGHEKYVVERWILYSFQARAPMPTITQPCNQNPTLRLLATSERQHRFS
jgi:hypothetical protein